jgi:hypothetical protein
MTSDALSAPHVLVVSRTMIAIASIEPYDRRDAREVHYSRQP